MRRIALGGLVATVCMALLVPPALGGVALPYSDNFDTAPELWDSSDDDPKDGKWYPDRYAPDGFTNEYFDDDYRLKHTVASDDYDANNSFYNYQGRKLDVGPAQNAEVSIDLYIGSDWEDTDRHASVWGTGFDGEEVSAYPILGYTETEDTSEDGSFRWFHDVDGAWFDIGRPQDFEYDAWYTLSYALQSTTQGETVTFTVTGPTGETVTGNLTHEGWDSTLENVMLQVHNDGESYDVYWDNLSVVPEPATMAFLGLGGLGVILKRRRA